MIQLTEITMRTAVPEDARGIWKAIAEIGSLERNSCYAYLLLCSHFSSTSVIAEQDGNLVGFVLSYRPPSDPSAVFVWQVGVLPQARGKRLAAAMLQYLSDLPACRDAQDLTASVTPDNLPSAALFRSFAQSRGTSCHEETGFFSSALFAEPHADEHLFRISLRQGKP